MKKVSEIKEHAQNVLARERSEWLDGIKEVAGETMRDKPFRGICIRFIPEPRWETGTVVNGTLFISGDWRELLGDDYAQLAKVMLESDPFFEGWRVDIGMYMDMQYLVVTEISRSKNG